MGAAGLSNGGKAQAVHILLVTGENPVRADGQAGLATRGFSVTAVADGATAIKSISRCPVDLVLLDLVLPDVEGIALLSAIRAARPTLPVIALTAPDDELLRLESFARGADDCVSKPLSIPELTARIEARLRGRQQGDAVVSVGPLSVDVSRNRAAIDGHVVALSPREASLLATFVHHAGEVLSRELLLQLVWELEFDPGSNIVDVYVAALRRKIGAGVIETIKGRGYRLRVSALSSIVDANV
jgi:two-component system copper resistance phosphate regulon response regulator CusR